jgi:hypothetical protein
MPLRLTVYTRTSGGFGILDSTFPHSEFRICNKKMGVRSILLALSFRVKKVRKYVAYYFPVAEKFFV